MWKVNALTPALSRIARYFNRWRLALLIFLLVYTAILLLDLGYAAIQWDETPHLYDALLLNRGLQDFIQRCSRYPPLFTVMTAFYFKIFGASVFSGRLVAVTFGVLSAWVVFEFAYRLYGPRNALISSVLLATMPGFIILSRITLLETMLIFFFSISLLLFFSWMKTNNDKMLLLSGVTLGLAFLVKYQALVGGLVMLVSMFLWGRDRIRARIRKFLLLIIIVAVIALPWILLTSGRAQTWLYVLQVGSENTLEYSQRYPFPIFYLIEMANIFPGIYPISLPIYILALLGLGFWLWRRSPEDKFSLIWFFLIYAIFELIPAKSWRYVTLVFPILAISASSFFLLILDKVKDRLRAYQANLCKIDITKVATVFLTVLLLISILYSSQVAYLWAKRYHFDVPVGEASRYVAERSEVTETVVVLCIVNFFSVDTVEFYLQLYNPGQRQPLSYPELAVDAYMLPFNVSELIEISEAWGVKYLLLYEHGNNTFFQSELTSQHVLDMLLDSGSFSKEAEFGSFPRRIYVIQFLPNF